MGNKPHAGGVVKSRLSRLLLQPRGLSRCLFRFKYNYCEIKNELKQQLRVHRVNGRMVNHVCHINRHTESWLSTPYPHAELSLHYIMLIHCCEDVQGKDKAAVKTWHSPSECIVALPARQCFQSAPLISPPTQFNGRSVQTSNSPVSASV